MTRRSIVAAISICVHVAVLLFAMTADLWRPITDWPTPRTAIAFIGEHVSRAVLDDIPLEPRVAPTTTSSAATTPTFRPDAAPVTPPDAIGAADAPTLPPALTPNHDGPNGDVDVRVVPITPPAPTEPPAPPPAHAPIRLHSGIRAPQRLVNVAPVYPSIAKSARVEGVVIIEATIDEQGTVIRAQILRSIPLLDAAALDAVRQWRFSPTLLNGVPVPIVMTVTVNFRLE